VPEDLKAQARYLIDHTGQHDQPNAVFAGSVDEVTPPR